METEKESVVSIHATAINHSTWNQLRAAKWDIVFLYSSNGVFAVVCSGCFIYSKYSHLFLPCWIIQHNLEREVPIKDLNYIFRSPLAPFNTSAPSFLQMSELLTLSLGESHHPAEKATLFQPLLKACDIVVWAGMLEWLLTNIARHLDFT